MNHIQHILYLLLKFIHPLSILLFIEGRWGLQPIPADIGWEVGFSAYNLFSYAIFIFVLFYHCHFLLRLKQHKISDSAPWTAPVWNLSNASKQRESGLLFVFHRAFYRVTVRLHVRFLQTNVDLWTPTKTHSLAESIIQYVQSEITDDLKIGTTWCQEARPSRLAHTFQGKGGLAKKRHRGLPITCSNDNTGDEWRQ